MKSIFVEANYRIISRAKGVQLCYPTNLVVEHKVQGGDLGVAGFFALVEASVREQAVNDFVRRLKTDTALKRKVGGTKWAVELVGDMMDFPIYLQREQVGTIDKLINTHFPYRIMEEIRQRNLVLINQINREAEPV